MAIGPDEVRKLAAELESDRVERTVSTWNTTKFREAICAFANDMPGHGTPGYLLIGVADDGMVVGANVTDTLLLNLAALRSDGQIQPIPSMRVYKVDVAPSVAVAVIEVAPADAPPVRAEGRVCIRVGPRRAATQDDERRLNERRISHVRTFDQHPCRTASLDDVLIGTFRSTYLPKLVTPDVIAANARSIEHQLASARFFDVGDGVPTYGGILAMGRDPTAHVPGAYVQLVRLDGATRGAPVIDSHRSTGNIADQVRDLTAVLPLHTHVARRPAEAMRYEDVRDYPLAALREFALNAILHRDYSGTNAPVHIYWFTDRVEIQSPGGLYGRVTAENFGLVTDYRNPVLAEALRVLGFIERFGIGIAQARDALAKNGNPPPEFVFDPAYVLVTLRPRP